VTRRLLPVVLWGSLTLTTLFLAVPLLALFLRVPPAELVAQLGSETARTALLLSLETSLIAHALVLAIGTPAAYLLATRRFSGRALLVSALELPIVLPPAVAGIALLAAFGRGGLLGDELQALGISIPFTTLAVVLAICFVASPFYLRAAIAAFEGVDVRLVEASRTLGAGPARTFRRVVVPLAAAGLGAGSTLAFARGLGEFGATIMFAGSFPGRTQTAPLAIYASLDEDPKVGFALGALLVLTSVAVLALAKLIPSWSRYTSISPIGSERSLST
jgi:molybdate transport system permease protein